MGIPPTGTVTFLFTDIEGSTKLAQQYPKDAPILFKRHNQILRQAIQSHNGFVFRTVGDAFCVAFHTACDALKAALDAQRCLHQENWLPAPIKVRMVKLMDMGEWLLKDILQPEHLYQVAVPDLPAEFPALNTLKTVRMPVEQKEFGDEKEFASMWADGCSMTMDQAIELTLE